ncbi:hypothetical protein K8T06_05515 [bacterium]|nr:hypothetical protein [bacterium]
MRCSFQSTLFVTITVVVSLVWMIPGIYSAVCIAPDNGTGTVDLPAMCPYIAPNEPMIIIDGLPVGTTMELEPIYDGFFCNLPSACSMTMSPGVCEISGGSLGGELQCFEGLLGFQVTGTGDLTGFNRYLTVPLFTEIHTAPRIPGTSVQTFPSDMITMQGQMFGDPDFCEFIILGGTGLGLPSPGQTELTQLPDSTFNVDSFFDITYQIQFEGCPGSPLDGFAGITTATVRWQQGLPFEQPSPTPTVPPLQVPSLSYSSFTILIFVFTGILCLLRKRSQI